jgi:hypothetical protein
MNGSRIKEHRKKVPVKHWLILALFVAAALALRGF